MCRWLASRFANSVKLIFYQNSQTYSSIGDNEWNDDVDVVVLGMHLRPVHMILGIIQTVVSLSLTWFLFFHAFLLLPCARTSTSCLTTCLFRVAHTPLKPPIRTFFWSYYTVCSNLCFKDDPMFSVHPSQNPNYTHVLDWNQLILGELS